MTSDTTQQSITNEPSITVSSSTGRRKIQAVLFDLDGTLVDTESLSDQAMLLSLKAYIPAHVFQQLLTPPHGEMLLPWELKKQILGLRGSEWGPVVLDFAQQHWQLPHPSSSLTPTPQQLWDAWEHHLNALCPQVVSCRGAYELVQTLADRGIPMALATSSRASAVAQKSKNHQRMFEKLSVVVTGDDPAVLAGKPAPDIYLEAARRLGVAPQYCLVVEDALSGVQAGKRAGCVVVAVPDARFTESEKVVFLEWADVVLDDLCQFDVRILDGEDDPSASGSL